jgi:hypothetical protein
MKKFFFVILSLILNLNLYAFECHKVIEINDGFTHCQNLSQNYPLPIHIFIPKKIDLSLKINLNIHFHGHNLPGYNHFNKSYGDYGQYLSESDSNSILVIPESSGKCETYDNFLAIENNFLMLFYDISKQIQYPLSQLSFSGHSGAFRILRKIFSFKNLESKLNLKIAGVALFDALYGEVNAIELFTEQKIKNNRPFLFYCAYVSGKLETTEKISSQLKIKHQEKEQYIFIPVSSPEDNLLNQHFNILKSSGLKTFLNLLESTSF